MQLGQRPGPRPRTSCEGPHRQRDQQATPELWGRLVAQVFDLPHTVEGRSQVSPASSRAVLFDDLREVADPATSLAPDPPLEPVHLHGVTDTSAHLCLPADRARDICARGWGEPHGYAEHDTEDMVYGPRNTRELHVVLGLIRESLAHARRANGAGLAPNVLVMNEHGVEYPLWHRPHPPGDFGNPIVDLPGMSASMGRRLQEWNAQFERLALTDFAWESPDVEAAWERRGIALAIELQVELGPGVTVWYQGLGDQPRPISEVTATPRPATDTAEST